VATDWLMRCTANHLHYPSSTCTVVSNASSCTRNLSAFLSWVLFRCSSVTLILCDLAISTVVGPYVSDNAVITSFQRVPKPLSLSVSVTITAIWYFQFQLRIRVPCEFFHYASKDAEGLYRLTFVLRAVRTILYLIHLWLSYVGRFNCHLAFEWHSCNQ